MIYEKPSIYNGPILYNGAGGIYKGRGVYKDGAGGGEDFIEIGGRIYPVVKIGNQLWIAENLDWKFSGLNITTAQSNSPCGNYYNGQENIYGWDGGRFGLLYNFAAASYIENNKDILGVPNGWRIPTLNDINTLCLYCGGYDVAGGKLKAETSWSTGGTNDFGFNAKGAGAWEAPPTSEYLLINNLFGMWTQENIGARGYLLYLTNANSATIPNWDYYGYISIRLVKDA